MTSQLLGRLALLTLMVAPVPASAGGRAGAGSGFDFAEAGLTLQAELPIGGDYFGYGLDALWVMNGPRLFRLDAGDNTTTSTWIEGATGVVRGIVTDDESVWVPDVGSQKIYKFDPRSRSVRLKIYADMYGRDGSIAIAFGSVWVVTVNDRLLERFSTDTGKRQASITLPSDGAGVVIGNGAVWVSGNLKGELYRIDPATNTVVATIRLHKMPRLMVPAFDSVWIMNEGDATVQRVDAATGGVIATIELGEQPSWGDITAGAGYIWAAMPGIPLAQIDPRTNTAVRIFRAHMKTGSLRYGAGSLWFGGQAVRRIAPPIPTQ